MHRIRFTMSPEFVKRFRGFLSSPQYRNIPSHAKADYWRYHSKMISMAISENKVTVAGHAGNYIPRRKNLSSRMRELLSTVRERVLSGHLRLMSYCDAFDAIMEQRPIAGIECAPYRINFRSLTTNGEVIASIKEMRKRYFARKKYLLNEHMVRAYYLYNILQGYTRINEMETIMEIGAGNGNLASLLHYYLHARIIIVDLPETICLSIPFIVDLFPDAKVVLPNEILDLNHEYDFLFLTPSQIEHIPDNYVDLAINTDSFQEMTHSQIKEYFDLVQRCGRIGSYFLTSNRVEKIPVGESTLGQPVSSPPNRFVEFPWDPRNEIIIYEPCKLVRLVQLDDCYLRLESIRK